MTPVPNNPKRVYCVEDSAGIRARLISELSSIPGVAVVGWAPDAPTASREIPNLQPDLVILDLHLAAGSGIDVLRECRACDGATPFVVLTNHSYDVTRNRTLLAGANAFFDKSTQFDEFFTYTLGLLSQ